MGAASLLLAAAAASAAPLAGVADEEATIRTRIIQHVEGKGDVLFVRDAIGRWYRVALSAGCLDRPDDANRVAFRAEPVTGYVNRFSSVSIARTGRVCGIESIRRSAVPPQRDSNSPVTLD